jgi:formate hydrogenlyase subunit 4
MTSAEIGIHVAFVLLMPPLLRGVINRTKAVFAGRVGPPLLQPYYDIIKLFRKDFVFSTTTSWVFNLGTVITLVSTFLAALFVPLGFKDVPMSFGGDVILFAYLFAVGRFFMTASAMDVGSSFEGMGAAREVTFACLAEPALFFGLLVMTQLSAHVATAGEHILSLHYILGPSLPTEWQLGASSMLLVLVSWFIVMLAENSRIPFDDPNTHLELTMIHEVIILDHGGPVLGMMLYAAAIKLFIFAALLVRIAVPFDMGHLLGLSDTMGAWLDWGVFFVATLALAVLIGVVESTMARLKMTEVPKLLATACVLSALALILRVS